MLSNEELITLSTLLSKGKDDGRLYPLILEADDLVERIHGIIPTKKDLTGVNIPSPIIAIDSCIMDCEGDSTLTIGNSYDIVSQSSAELLIVDDSGIDHYFDKDKVLQYFTIPSLTH